MADESHTPALLGPAAGAVGGGLLALSLAALVLAPISPIARAATLWIALEAAYFLLFRSRCAGVMQMLSDLWGEG